MAIKRYDSSNINTKTGKAKTMPAPVAKQPATKAQVMAAPKVNPKPTGGSPGLQINKLAAMSKPTATSKAPSNTIREAITATKRREAAAKL